MTSFLSFPTPRKHHRPSPSKRHTSPELHLPSLSTLVPSSKPNLTLPSPGQQISHHPFTVPVTSYPASNQKLRKNPSSSLLSTSKHPIHRPCDSKSRRRQLTNPDTDAQGSFMPFGVSPEIAQILDVDHRGSQSTITGRARSSSIALRLPAIPARCASFAPTSASSVVRIGHQQAPNIHTLIESNSSAYQQGQSESGRGKAQIMNKSKSKSKSKRETMKLPMTCPAPTSYIPATTMTNDSLQEWQLEPTPPGSPFTQPQSASLPSFLDISAERISPFSLEHEPSEHTSDGTTTGSTTLFPSGTIPTTTAGQRQDSHGSDSVLGDEENGEGEIDALVALVGMNEQIADSALLRSLSRLSPLPDRYDLDIARTRRRFPAEPIVREDAHGDGGIRNKSNASGRPALTIRPDIDHHYQKQLWPTLRSAPPIPPPRCSSVCDVRSGEKGSMISVGSNGHTGRPPIPPRSPHRPLPPPASLPPSPSSNTSHTQALGRTHFFPLKSTKSENDSDCHPDRDSTRGGDENGRQAYASGSAGLVSFQRARDYDKSLTGDVRMGWKYGNGLKRVGSESGPPSADNQLPIHQRPLPALPGVKTFYPLLRSSLATKLHLRPKRPSIPPTPPESPTSPKRFALFTSSLSRSTPPPASPTRIFPLPPVTHTHARGSAHLSLPPGSANSLKPICVVPKLSARDEPFARARPSVSTEDRKQGLTALSFLVSDSRPQPPSTAPGKVNNEDSSSSSGESIKATTENYSPSATWRAEYTTSTPRLSLDSASSMGRPSSPVLGYIIPPEELARLVPTRSRASSGSSWASNTSEMVSGCVRAEAHCEENSAGGGRHSGRTDGGIQGKGARKKQSEPPSLQLLAYSKGEWSRALSRSTTAAGGWERDIRRPAGLNPPPRRKVSTGGRLGAVTPITPRTSDLINLEGGAFGPIGADHEAAPSELTLPSHQANFSASLDSPISSQVREGMCVKRGSFGLDLPFSIPISAQPLGSVAALKGDGYASRGLKRHGSGAGSHAEPDATINPQERRGLAGDAREKFDADETTSSTFDQCRESVGFNSPCVLEDTHKEEETNRDVMKIWLRSEVKRGVKGL